MKKHQKNDCPTPHKKAFETKYKAKSELHQIWRRGFRGGAHGLPLRAYKCRCGMFHLTSKGRKEPSRHRPTTSTRSN